MSESSSDIMELEEGTLFTHPEITKKSNCNPRHNNNINPACMSIETDVWLLGIADLTCAYIVFNYEISVLHSADCLILTLRYRLQWRRWWQHGGRCWVSCQRATAASCGTWRRPPSHLVIAVTAGASVTSHQPVQSDPSGAPQVKIARDHQGSRDFPGNRSGASSICDEKRGWEVEQTQNVRRARTNLSPFSRRRHLSRHRLRRLAPHVRIYVRTKGTGYSLLACHVSTRAARIPHTTDSSVQNKKIK